MTSAPRHQRKVCITVELLASTFAHGNHVNVLVSKGMPADVVFVGCSHDPLHGQLWLIFEHESFDAVIEGEDVPRFDPEFTTVNQHALAQLVTIGEMQLKLANDRLNTAASLIDATLAHLSNDIRLLRAKK